MRNFSYCYLVLLGLTQAAEFDVTLSGLAKRDTCTEPPSNSCAFYPDCLEERLNCGPEGYPIGYGLHYCDLFQQNAGEFSPEGQKWITDTMLCLQHALVPLATGEQPPTCDGLKNFAIGTHPGCYVDSGVCELPPTDWALIVDTIGLPGLLGDVESLKATLQAAVGCVEFYSWLVSEGIIDVFEDTVKSV